MSSRQFRTGAKSFQKSCSMEPARTHTRAATTAAICSCGSPEHEVSKLRHYWRWWEQGILQSFLVGKKGALPLSLSRRGIFFGTCRTRMGKLEEACKDPTIPSRYLTETTLCERTCDDDHPPGVLSFAIWRSLDNLSEHDEPVLPTRRSIVAPPSDDLQGFRPGHKEQAKTNVPSPKTC